MILRNTDLIINWHQLDDPGDYPRWESNCGVVEQRGWGDNPAYYGFVGPERRPIERLYTTTLRSAKRDVETEYMAMVSAGIAPHPINDLDNQQQSLDYFQKKP